MLFPTMRAYFSLKILRCGNTPVGKAASRPCAPSLPAASQSERHVHASTELWFHVRGEHGSLHRQLLSTWSTVLVTRFHQHGQQVFVRTGSRRRAAITGNKSVDLGRAARYSRLRRVGTLSGSGSTDHAAIDRIVTPHGQCFADRFRVGFRLVVKSAWLAMSGSAALNSGTTSKTSFSAANFSSVCSIVVCTAAPSAATKEATCCLEMRLRHLPLTLPERAFTRQQPSPGKLQDVGTGPLR